MLKFFPVLNCRDGCKYTMCGLSLLKGATRWFSFLNCASLFLSPCLSCSILRSWGSVQGWSARRERLKQDVFVILEMHWYPETLSYKVGMNWKFVECNLWILLWLIYPLFFQLIIFNQNVDFLVKWHTSLW